MVEILKINNAVHYLTDLMYVIVEIKMRKIEKFFGENNSRLIESTALKVFVTTDIKARYVNITFLLSSF